MSCPECGTKARHHSHKHRKIIELGSPGVTNQIRLTYSLMRCPYCAAFCRHPDVDKVAPGRARYSDEVRQMACAMLNSGLSYRQVCEDLLTEFGVPLPETTLCDWMAKDSTYTTRQKGRRRRGRSRKPQEVKDLDGGEVIPF